jgi:hypothetical protein
MDVIDLNAVLGFAGHDKPLLQSSPPNQVPERGLVHSGQPELGNEKFRAVGRLRDGDKISVTSMVFWTLAGET